MEEKLELLYLIMPDLKFHIYIVIKHVPQNLELSEGIKDSVKPLIVISIKEDYRFQ